MTTNLDPASELFLANVYRIQQPLVDANRQGSSGKRVDQPSDAPDTIDTLLQLRSDRQRNTQIRANLTLALTEGQSADEALTAAIRILDRARALATQAVSATDANARRALAEDAQGLLEQ